MRTCAGSATGGRRRSRAAALLAFGALSCAVYEQRSDQADGGLSEAGSGSGGSSTAGSSSGAGSGATPIPTGGVGGGAAGGAGGTRSPVYPGAGAQNMAGEVGAGGGGEEAGAAPVDLPRELSTGHPASASASQAERPAEMGNDGSHQTRWSSGTTALPQWWQVDLGQTFTLESITVRWEFGNVEYSYAIEVSDTGAAFYPKVVVDAGIGPPQTNAFPAGTTGRYVRIKITSVVPENWSSIYEVTVQGR